MATVEKTLELKGASGTLYRFFPRYPLAQNRDSKGAGIYMFTNKNDAITDIQFLTDEEEIKATLQRMKDNGADAFYFRDEMIDEIAGDGLVDDIKRGDDYRKKAD